MYIDTILQTITNLGAAFMLGGIIGFERQWRQRLAGKESSEDDEGCRA